MAKTVHRNPTTFSTNPGIDYKFFSTSNWAGLCSNKNLLNVNQETFEDCDNIYVDENGLLKSRPSLKRSKYESALNFWKFDDIVIKLFEERDYLLQITDGSITKTHYLLDDKIKILKYGEKIFVFSTEDVYFITPDLELQSAKDLIYNPVRYTYFNDVRSKDVIETDNILTNAYRESYIYNNIPKISNPKYKGKPVTVNIDGRVEKYDEFEEGREDLLFFHKFSISNSNYIDGHLLLDVSDAGNMILSSWEIVNDKRRWTIKHSLNGTTFEEILTPDGHIIGLPIISRDGTFVVVFKTDGPYALSLVNDANGARVFNTWTNLLKYNELYEELDIPTHIGTSINDIANGVFYNASTFFIATSYNNADVPFRMYGVVNGDIYLREGSFVSALNYTPNVKVTYTDGYHMLVTTITSGSILDVYDVYYTDDYKNHNTYTRISLSNKSKYHLLENDVIKLDNESLRFTYDGGIWDGDNAKEATMKYFLDAGSKFLKFVYGQNVLSDRKYFIGPTYDKFLDVVMDDVIIVNDIIWYTHGNYVYNNYIGDNYLTVDVHYDGEVTSKVFDYIAELNELYVSLNNKLYISSAKYNDYDKLLYFPKISEQTFDSKITNIHPISENQVAIFLSDCIWYTQITENGYAYYKSKLQVGLRDGEDVLTSPDAQYIIFPTERGLTYLGYQSLVQSKEQVLTYLSDNIQSFWKNLYVKPVKLYFNKYWLYCYNERNAELLLFDIRNNSWWKWTLPDEILKILYLDELVMITNKFTGHAYTFNYDFENYIDYGEKYVNWYFTSQRLHLGTLNYYKNVMSIIINNVENGIDVENVSYNLEVKNYRISSSNRYLEPENFSYKVDALRTFVKRCNSRKVNEFQYTLSSDTGDNGDVIQSPLSIHSIIIKYTISGQVR